MRVLVLSNLYPPNAMGGYELSCRDVVDRWRDRGHRVTVLTTAGSVGGVVERGRDEPHVRRELGWYWSEHRFLRPRLPERIRIERANQRALRRALHDVRPDVVSVWHMGGMSWSLLTSVLDAGVPMVCNICDDWPVYGPAVDAWSATPDVVRRLAGRVARVPHRLPDLDRSAATFVSAFTRDQVRERTPWAFPDATVVGSGVDPRDFPMVAAPADRAWRGRLLAVGRVEPRKGFDTAVAGLAQLPSHWRLRIAGVADPSYLQGLLEQAERLGVADQLEVLAVPRAEVRDLYAEADVLVFPSRWEEPFGLVPLEAMSQGVPVVATRRGGSAEFLVDGDNCLEMAAGEADSLARAVLRLAEDPALRSLVQAGGLRTASTYTVDRLAGTLEAVHLAQVR